MVSYKTVTLQNGTLQNCTCYKKVRVTKCYMLQNGTCYKTVHITKRYVLQKSAVTKQYVLQTVHYKTYMLQNSTFVTLYDECTNPWVSWVFVLT
jgi:hypothetical protein